MSRTRIKICGLYREQHVDYVNAARPDYAGFVFYPPSHRYVDREMMKRLREKLSHKIPAVGVFVNVPMEEVASYIEEGLIEIAQLHGAETEEDIRKLRILAPKAEIWKAFKIRDTKTLEKTLSSGRGITGGKYRRSTGTVCSLGSGCKFRCRDRERKGFWQNPGYHRNHKEQIRWKRIHQEDVLEFTADSISPKPS